MHGDVNSRGHARNILLGIIAASVIVTGLLMYVKTGVTPEQASADSQSAPLSAPSSGGYIKLGDIKGEATDKDHTEWINILSISQAITRPMATGATGSTRERQSPQLGDIVVVKELDKSTPKLQEAVITGEHFPTVTLDLTSSSADSPQPYLTFELKDVFVSNYRLSGGTSGGDRPTETFSLNFGEIRVIYSEQTADGRAGGKIEYGWKDEEGTK